MKRTILCLIALAMLTACGGGGDQQGSTDNLPASPVIARHP